MRRKEEGGGSEEGGERPFGPYKAGGRSGVLISQCFIL